jgi:hypothetical protein
MLKIQSDENSVSSKNQVRENITFLIFKVLYIKFVDYLFY